MGWIVFATVCNIALLVSVLCRSAPYALARALCVLVFFLVGTFIGSINKVAVGSIEIPVWFNEVQQSYFVEGVRFINPMLSTVEMNVQQRVVELSSKQGGDDAVALTKDQTVLSVDVGLPYSLNPTMAWKLYKRVGKEDAYVSRIIRPSATAALRDGLSQFTWAAAATTSEGRDAVSEAMQTAFGRHVAAQLVSLGFSISEAQSTFTIAPVQLRQLLPPVELRQAVANKLAEVENLKRQATLTEIANEQANRRAAEGTGVERLFTNLPKGFTAEQISLILNAIANKERADSLMKAVETGKVTGLVFEGGAQPAVPIK